MFVKFVAQKKKYVGLVISSSALLGSKSVYRLLTSKFKCCISNADKSSKYDFFT